MQEQGPIEPSVRDRNQFNSVINFKRKDLLALFILLAKNGNLPELEHKCKKEPGHQELEQKR